MHGTNRARWLASLPDVYASMAVTRALKFSDGQRCKGSLLDATHRRGSFAPMRRHRGIRGECSEPTTPSPNRPRLLSLQLTRSPRRLLAPVKLPSPSATRHPPPWQPASPTSCTRATTISFSFASRHRTARTAKQRHLDPEFGALQVVLRGVGLGGDEVPRGKALRDAVVDGGGLTPTRRRQFLQAQRRRLRVQQEGAAADAAHRHVQRPLRCGHDHPLHRLRAARMW